MSKSPTDKLASKEPGNSMLFQAISSIVKSSSEIAKDAQNVLDRFTDEFGDSKRNGQVADMAADKIISTYSRKAAISGAISAAPATIPGWGTAIALTGGAGADVLITMKFQVEMVMSIATVYGEDITEKKIADDCYVIAGLVSFQRVGTKIFKEKAAGMTIRVLRQYLRGATLKALKEIFKMVGIVFTRKALEKIVPVIGIPISALANLVLTRYIGKMAKKKYSMDMSLKDLIEG